MGVADPVVTHYVVVWQWSATKPGRKAGGLRDRIVGLNGRQIHDDRKTKSVRR